MRAAGFAIVTYDAPGHGASGRGMSSMPEFARALSAVVAHTAHGRVPRAVIAHSLGCAGVALALSWGLEVGRLVFLAPAADPPAWLPPFARALALRPHVMELLRARSERRLRVRWTDLNVCDMARQFSRTAPLLIVHDKNDETVAWNDGSLIAAAWPGARLVTTQGLGHRGVTRDEQVVQQVVDFVNDGAVTKPSRRDSESQRLEYELFYREERYSLNSTPRPSPSPVWGS